MTRLFILKMNYPVNPCHWIWFLICPVSTIRMRDRRHVDTWWQPHQTAFFLIQLTNRAVSTTIEIAQGNDKTRERGQDVGLDVLSTGFSLECKCKTALRHRTRLRKTTVVMNPGLHIFPLEEERRADIYLNGNNKGAHFILVRIFQPQSIWSVTINNGGHGELRGPRRALLTVRFCQHSPDQSLWIRSCVHESFPAFESSPLMSSGIPALLFENSFA